MIRLRPHHLLCTQAYSGKGYNAGFVENMSAITNHLRINADAVIGITLSTDDICSKCPLMIAEDECKTNEKVKRYDSKVVRHFNIEEKSYVYHEIVNEIKAKITPEILEDICGDCGWYPMGECKRSIL